MTIPSTPLELDIETVTLTLGDMEIFDLDLAESEPLAWLLSVRRFLVRHSVSWSRAQIRDIGLDELKDIGPQVAEATRKRAVPLPSSGPSRTGRATRAKTARRAGLPSSSLPESSTSHPTKSASE